MAGEKWRRRIRSVNELGGFHPQGYYSAVDAVIHSTSPCFPGVTGLVLDEERNFYALFYALILQEAAAQDAVIMTFLSPVPAG